MKYNLAEHRTAAGIRWYKIHGMEKMPHMISGRHGGASDPPYESLNLGDHVGDNQGDVTQNRRRVNQIISERLLYSGAPDVFTVKQVHGDGIVIVGEGDIPQSDTCHGDAVIVTSPGIPVGVLTADCIPVIMFAPGASAVVHAGRLGVALDITGKTVARLAEISGADKKDILCGIAPGIGPCCYEVDEKAAEPFKSSKTLGVICRPAGIVGKYMLDLQLGVELQLIESGVSRGNIYRSEVCTSCSKKEFFSHRAENGKTGRFITVVSVAG